MTVDEDLAAARAALAGRDFPAALARVENILAASPGHGEATLLRGIARQQMQDLQGAESDFRAVLQTDPNQLLAAHNLGVICMARGDTHEAGRLYDIALAAKPDFYEALVNRGVVHQFSGEWEQARQKYHAAHKVRPDGIEALWRLTELFRYANKLDHAIAFGRKAIELAPDNAQALAQLTYARMRACDWPGLGDELARLKSAVEKRLDADLSCPIRPFVAMVTYDDPAFNLRVARAEADKIARQTAPLRQALGPIPEGHADDRIRLGYFSAGFGDRPTSHLTRRLYRLHDREKFEVYGFSVGPDDGSHFRKGIAADCDEFVDLGPMDTLSAARAIRERNIDILIDMRGYLQNNRIAISATRPAPVQISYLAYPSTTGADFLDYIIADRTVIPEVHEAHFAEAPVFMPHCYQINDPDQPTDPTPPSRVDCGLPNDAVVFSSFNINYKIDPIMFGAWTKILAAVPNSVLWLLRSDPIAEKNLKSAAAADGIDPARLVFADFADKARHMARLSLADLGVDTRICNGHTTTTDMLCAGVPVLTLQGRHFASRVASSLLLNHGLPEMVASSVDDYIARAVALGNDPAALAVLKQKVQANKKTAPLFDVKRYVRDMEKAYELVWARHLAGDPPAPIAVPK